MDEERPGERVEVPRFIVVVHLTSPEHAAEQADLALAAGAGGVFLINHFDPPSALGPAVASVRARVGDAPWVGVNPLGTSCVEAANLVQELASEHGRVDGLWCDDAEIDERPGGMTTRPAAASAARLGWGGSYFGGVAFKYQRAVDDHAAAAEAAVPWMDVVCTSGPGTGQAADLGALRSMHDALRGRRPLAVASGVTVENVHGHLECADVLVVATGVSTSYTELDPARITVLAALL